MFKTLLKIDKVIDDNRNELKEIREEIKALKQSVWELENPSKFKFNDRVRIIGFYGEKDRYAIYKGKTHSVEYVNGLFYRECYIEEEGCIHRFNEGDLRMAE